MSSPGAGRGSAQNKATIVIKKKTGDVNINCHFNPTDYTITGSNTWNSSQKAGHDVPTLNFVGRGGKSMTLSVMFDTTLRTGDKDVRSYTKLLWQSLYIDNGTRHSVTKVGEPPHIIFIWGKTYTFEAILESISESFVLFDQNGVPLRSNVSLTLKQVKDEKAQPKQNPTSGGISGTIYTIKEGDRLDLIANQYYQKPMLWRYIAEHNDIDNPRHLEPGQRLIIPELP